MWKKETKESKMKPKAESLEKCVMMVFLTVMVYKCKVMVMPEM